MHAAAAAARGGDQPDPLLTVGRGGIGCERVRSIDELEEICRMPFDKIKLLEI